MRPCVLFRASNYLHEAYRQEDGVSMRTFLRKNNPYFRKKMQSSMKTTEISEQLCRQVQLGSNQRYAKASHWFTDLNKNALLLGVFLETWITNSDFKKIYL